MKILAAHRFVRNSDLYHRFDVSAPSETFVITLTPPRRRWQVRDVVISHLGPRYRLLGPVSAETDAGPVRLGGPKQRTVLAALLLNANRAVSEEQLIDLLWEDGPPSSARGQLQLRVFELRKLLGRAVIVRCASGYLIEVPPGELDLDAFRDIAAEARAELAAGRTSQGIERLREALNLWQGTGLGGVTEVLARREGPVLEELRVTTQEELFEAEIAAGRCAHLIGELRRAAEECPFRERLLAQLMTALSRSNRVSDALDVYAESRRRFAAELGIEPGKALRDLHARILRGEIGGSVAIPLQAGQPRPTTLPAAVRGFAGRTRALEVLDNQLRTDSGEPSADIWVVSGIAGVGKTALAVEWAHRVRDQFSDGQLYVDLRGFEADREPMTSATALAQLLRSLGVEPRRIPGELDEQAGLYRSLLADRRVLMILDNARDAEQVWPLLPPTGTVLVTSRNRLGDLMVSTGARSLRLGVLPADDSRALLVALLGAGPVAAELAAVDELARLCGQLPLALRIAAAKLGANPQPGIAGLTAELARHGVLTGLTLDGATESAVTRAFVASYRALAPAQRKLFRLLGSVLEGEFSTRTAAEVTGTPVDDVLLRLCRLAAASLVEELGNGRFRLHRLLREFALCQVRVDDASAPEDLRLPALRGAAG
jgi:DNA-binding SARP family transcriptional activator